MKTIHTNSKTYTCPFYDLMPPLTAEEHAELAADIKEHGVTVAVVVTDDDEVIDGHNRLEIAAELGLVSVPVEILSGLTLAQKRQRAVDLNLHRRHMTRQQKQEIIARRLKEDPSQSDREIAAVVGVEHKTVGAARSRLEAAGEIPQLSSTKGRDGRSRRRPKRRIEHPPAATPATYAPQPNRDTPLPIWDRPPAEIIQDKHLCRFSDFQMCSAELEQLAKEVRIYPRAHVTNSKPDEAKALVTRILLVADSVKKLARADS